MIDSKNERLLVIAPHADDEVLGCGGLMTKIKKEGGKVFVLIFNVGAVNKHNSEKATIQWKEETASAMKFLKVDDYDTVFDSASENRYLDMKPLHELITIIENESKVSLNAVKPTIVAIPTSHSHHQDHIMVYEACIAALRPMRKPIPKMVLSYEAPEHSTWSRNGMFTPNFYVDIEKHIKTKMNAFQCYKSQIKLGGRDENSIKTQAQYRGRDVGRKFCESYYLHRFVD
jgi:N-acetylglucosamine malate deacetylase 1